MGFFSEMDIEVREMISRGASRSNIANVYPMLNDVELDEYFGDSSDDDIAEQEAFELADSFGENDWQPSTYEEYQELLDGGGWDRGSYNSDEVH